MVVGVIIELNNFALDQVYYYKSELDVLIGSKVKIPFNNRILEGFVISINNHSDLALKSIISVEEVVLTKELLMLVNYLRKTNLATYINCIHTILPNAYKASIRNKAKVKYEKYVTLIDYNYDNVKTKQLIIALKQQDLSLKAAKLLISPYYLKKLRETNIIKVYNHEVYRGFNTNKKVKLYDEPTNKQADICKNIINDEKLFHLIYGPTSSGKSVCYLELIKHYLKIDKQVLLLVPEITLTNQFIDIINYYFENQLAIFHSSLSSAEQYDQYRLVKENKVKIAIGTRSSIFLPFNNLGLIIIDEEHDESYIQEQVISYNTKEIATLRANYHHAKLVLGSATPDINTFYQTTNNKISLHKLTSKYYDNQTNNTLIDMKTNFDWIISGEVLQAIKAVIENNQQFIVLLNRRGYANYVTCSNCGVVAKCPNCELTLKLHENNILKCHHCKYETVATCSECFQDKFIEHGYGIQKVQEDLQSKLPGIRLARVDSDMKNPSLVLHEFNKQYYHGLIGTQIISKGLNLSQVSLVAIIDADYSLNLFSYKASEKTFQYIAQAIGRSGRSKAMKANNYVQVYDASHYAILTAINQDYETFYRTEIKFRENLLYPPFVKYTKILVSTSNLSLGNSYLKRVYLKLKDHVEFISNVSFSSVEKINNQYQLQILIKYSKKSKLFDIINLLREIERGKGINIIINSNPVNF